MPRFLLVFLLLYTTTHLLAQETTYATALNIPYYASAKIQSDSYIKERCVLDIYYPKNVKNFATVVWFHGGGLEYGNKSFPEELTNKGIAIIAVNYRLYPKIKAPVYIEDAAASVAWAFKNIEKYGGDPSLIFLSGHSAGGYLDLMVGLDQRWLKAHDVAANDIAGLIPFSGHTITHFTVRAERGIAGTQPIVDDLAPLYHVRADAPPLLLITGDRELELLGRYEENAYLMRMMKVAGHSDTRIMEMAGYGHDMTAPAYPLLLKEVERLTRKINLANNKNTEALNNGMKSGFSSESYVLYRDFPSQFTTPRNVEVWLPKNYEQLDSLPVLYMFDGQNIFHGVKGWGGKYNNGWQVDEVLDSLINAGAIGEVIVVGVFNSPNRMSDYMPEKPKELVAQRIAQNTDEWYDVFKTSPPVSDQQLQFLVKEVKPFIDQNFKTKSDRANTFVAGSSMGGLLSAYAICEYPEVFGGAACFSTHWPPLKGVFLEYIKNNLPDPATHKIYFDYGTAGLDATYEPFQNIADEAMQSRGFEKNKNWMTLKFEGEDHHEKDWHNRFHIPMGFLFSRE